MKSCEFCNQKFFGRTDKIFCNNHCRSAYHNQKKQNNENKYLNDVTKRLKKNRDILKLLKEEHGNAILNQKKLIDKGFDLLMITHFLKFPKNKIWRFCYDYGYIIEGEKVKIIKEISE